VTLTTAQQIRLKIADLPRLADQTFYGDGLASSFVLPHYNIISGSAFVPLAGASWSATGATFNASGMVSFASTIADTSAFRTTYVHSVFSDTEIDSFAEIGGDVNGAAIQALHTLMFDAAKRARWMGSDGSQFDDTLAADNLWKAYSAIREEQFQAGAAVVSMQSWTINQQDY
jgi:hypothetical protein